MKCCKYCRKLTNILYDYGGNQHAEFRAYPDVHFEVFTPVHHMTIQLPALLCMHFCNTLVSSTPMHLMPFFTRA